MSQISYHHTFLLASQLEHLSCSHQTEGENNQLFTDLFQVYYYIRIPVGHNFTYTNLTV